MAEKSNSKSHHLLTDWKILSGTAVLGVTVFILILELTNTTYLFHRQKIPAVIPASASSKPVSSNNSASKASNPNTAPSSVSSTKDSSSGGSIPSESTPLVNPYGNFVSNHHPDKASLDEVSVCNSTPGASCYIKFSNGQDNTQLANQNIGSDGASTWKWNIKDNAHLTSGEWQVTAVATLNGQTKTTDDPLKLVVP